MPTTSEQVITDTQLLELLQSRNVQAIELLYDQYSCMLYGIIFRIVNDAARAEEILFKTFTYAWNHYNHFDNNQQSLSMWMIGIARQLTFSSLTAVELINAESRLMNLFKDTMVKDKKVMLELIFLQGIGVNKIAERLGYSETDVKTFLHEATTELQNEFSTR